MAGVRARFCPGSRGMPERGPANNLWKQVPGVYPCTLRPVANWVRMGALMTVWGWTTPPPPPPPLSIEGRSALGAGARVARAPASAGPHVWHPHTEGRRGPTLCAEAPAPLLPRLVLGWLLVTHLCARLKRDWVGSREGLPVGHTFQGALCTPGHVFVLTFHVSQTGLGMNVRFAGCPGG